MLTKTLRAVAMIVVLFVSAAQAQKADDVFFPSVYWGENAAQGVILIKQTEMLIVDSKGDKRGKVLAAEAVTGIYLAPDGKKLIYTTATSVWFVEVETAQTRLLMKNACSYLRWSSDSQSFMFAVGEYWKIPSDVSSFKLFWADGAGKNLKQVYP